MLRVSPNRPRSARFAYDFFEKNMKKGLQFMTLFAILYVNWIVVSLYLYAIVICEYAPHESRGFSTVCFGGREKLIQIENEGEESK